MTDERRVVTVLFADVVDSTGLGESLDPEEVRVLLGRYFDIAREVLSSYGGTLEKFIGDAVVGVFGIPQAHGDDPKRAIDAALELRDRLRTDSQLSGLRVRFGLGTGEVVTTRGQGADFFVGDAVNVAARLQQAGDEWMILATERTVRSAATAFEVGPLRQIEVKGRTASVPAYEVRSRRHRLQKVSGPRLPIRGRADELEELRVFCRRAFRDRRPAVVSIIAPAGTGKTRLLEEFLDREAASFMPAPRVATAQCLPYGQQLTYWPLRQMLFQLVGIADEASSNQVRAEIEAWIDEPRTADLLARSIGAAEGEAPDRLDVFMAWRSAVETASRAQPLILVFEDLHWSSDSLLDLVEFVMQPRGEAPVLMLALARPELTDRRSSWGGGRRNFLNLFLEPLGDSEIRSLVTDLLTDQPAERAEQIVARAEGNPFYAEELVRSVLEHAHDAELPDTVQATVLARLDLLPETERRVLQLGSIFGRAFRVAGVEALAPDVPAVQTAVDHLLIGDLVRSTTEDSLEFRHILIRDVAYQTITRAERARHHAIAAGWLESQAVGREDALAEIIAFHYREALAMVGRQQPSNFDVAAVGLRAVTWLRRAAETTAAAGATIEAARHLQAAIRIAAADDLPELYERLGDVEQLRQGSVAAYRQALEYCRSAGRPADQQLRVIGGLLMCVQRWWEGVGRMTRPETEQLREAGQALASRATDERALARFLAADAFYPWHMHRQGFPVPADALATAEASARRAVELSERTGDFNTWSAALDGLASCAIERCDWSAARETAWLRVTQQARLVQVERLDAYHMVYDTSMALADLHEADRALEQGTALDWAPHSPEFVGLLSDQICVLALLGRWDELSTIADRAVKHWSEHHGASGPASFGFVAGYEVALARRSTALADRLHQALLQLAEEVASGPFLRAIAERDWDAIERGMLVRLDRGQGSDLRVERVLSTFADRRQPIRSETVSTILDHAVTRGLPLLEAQARRAAGQFDVAIEIWERSGALPYVARARIELARSRGRVPDAEDISTLRELEDLEYLEIHELGLES